MLNDEMKYSLKRKQYTFNTMSINTKKAISKTNWLNKKKEEFKISFKLYVKYGNEIKVI